MEKIITKIFLSKEKNLEKKTSLFYRKNREEINDLYTIVENHGLKVDYTTFVVFCYNNSINGRFTKGIY